MSKTPDQFAIAAALLEISALLELKGGKDRFKARAYQRSARVIAGLTEDLGTLIKQQRLTSIRGIGTALASQIGQLYETGASSVLSQLRQEFPPGVIELSRLPGLSLNKIKTLSQTLGIASTEDLRAAIEAGKLRSVKGFGARSEEKLLLSLESPPTSVSQRIHIHHANRIGQQLTDYLRTESALIDVGLAGSIRRAQETVGTIRIVASTESPRQLLEQFLRFPLIVHLAQKDPESCTVLLAEGAQVVLSAVRPNEYVWALWRETGTTAHFEKLQKVAARRRLRSDITSHKAFVSLCARGKQARAVAVTEPNFYRGLGLPYIPPELREDLGEIEAASKGKLPEDLVDLEDIQGMVHCHTTYSDGRDTIQAMAAAAEAMGMKYLTITDHSPTAFYAGGVTLDRLKRQWDEIDEVQENVKVKLLKGTESDIVANGGLDYPDRILKKFDVIVASIHSRYKMNAEQMTDRLITAMRTPFFKIWGHALGRLIHRRPPFECHIERVLDAIAESRAAIEINGDPFRLDMEPSLLREARKRRIKFVISVDAHSTGALQNLKYGVGIARRGWVRKVEVLNTLSAKAFAKAVRP